MKYFYPDSVYKFFFLVFVSLLISSPLVLLENTVSKDFFNLIFLVAFFINITALYIISANKTNHKYILKGEFKVLLQSKYVLLGIIFEIIFVAWSLLGHFILSNYSTASEKNLVFGLSVIVIAPIIEEWVFRGILLKSLLTRLSNNKSLLISSVLFGLIHINPVQIIGAIGLGYFYGYIYIKYKSVSNVVILHCLANLIGFISMMYIT